MIIPARNEERHIERCLESIIRQRVPGRLEVIIADGSSTDRTADLARAAGATVVANRARTTPAGLNAALERARGSVIVRFDAHAEMPPGYIEACMDTLLTERNAACVGGWRRVAACGPWGRATGAALASRAGVGNPRLWRRPHPDSGRVDVETVALGCWSATRLRAVGGWNERYLRNQDYELNHRLRRAGGRIVFDPFIWSIYRPRESLSALARQYFDYGRFKALMLVDEPGSLQPRQLAPVALLAAIGAATTRGAPRALARIALAGYGLLVATVASRSTSGARTGAVLVTMHVTWGGGLLVGIVSKGLPRLARSALARTWTRG